LLQGLSAGVEIGGASVYLAEIATPGHKGFFAAWQSGSQQVAVIFAALFGLVLTMNLSQNQMVRWGWRVPLWAGCAIIPLLLILRRSLTETDVFLTRKHRPPVREIVRTLFANWYIVLLGMMLSTLTTVSFYMITAYTPTYGSTVLHLASTGSLTVTLCVGISNFIWVPVMGALSDRIGRRPLLFAIALLALMTAYPALAWMVSAPSVPRLLAVELWFSFLFGSYSGGMVVYLIEVMPADVRTSGWSLSFSLATALFGGFTPAISTYLIRWSGNAAIPGVWLSFTALLGLTSLLLLGRYSAPGADQQ
jgi:MFS family permease